LGDTGGRWSGRPAAESRARELGVEHLIRFAGTVPYDEASHWLAAADTAVLPDCTDIITPIKVPEYMGMSIPALVPDYEANREVIEDEVTGPEFRPEDPEAMSGKLLRLQGDSTLRDRIGTAGRQWYSAGSSGSARGAGFSRRSESARWGSGPPRLQIRRGARAIRYAEIICSNPKHRSAAAMQDMKRWPNCER
jgi:hypothetical protein